jgi:hypothetical protein
MTLTAENSIWSRSTFDGTSFLATSALPTPSPTGNTTELVVVDAKTAATRVLATVPADADITNVGGDVIHTLPTVATAGGFERKLVKTPRAGGASTTLLTQTAPTLTELHKPYVAVAGSAFAVVRVDDDLVESRQHCFLVRLDGAGPVVDLGWWTIQQFDGKATLLRADETYRRIDLSTGVMTDRTPTSTAGTYVLAGDGSLFKRGECTTSANERGIHLRRVSAAGETVGPCEKKPADTDGIFERPIPNRPDVLWVFENRLGSRFVRGHALLMKP